MDSNYAFERQRKAQSVHHETTVELVSSKRVENRVMFPAINIYYSFACLIPLLVLPPKRQLSASR